MNNRRCKYNYITWRKLIFCFFLCGVNRAEDWCKKKGSFNGCLNKNKQTDNNKNNKKLIQKPRTPPGARKIGDYRGQQRQHVGKHNRWFDTDNSEPRSLYCTQKTYYTQETEEEEQRWKNQQVKTVRESWAHRQETKLTHDVKEQKIIKRQEDGNKKTSH